MRKPSWNYVILRQYFIHNSIIYIYIKEQVLCLIIGAGGGGNAVAKKNAPWILTCFEVVIGEPY